VQNDNEAWDQTYRHCNVDLRSENILPDYEVNSMHQDKDLLGLHRIVYDRSILRGGNHVFYMHAADQCAITQCRIGGRKKSNDADVTYDYKFGILNTDAAHSDTSKILRRGNVDADTGLPLMDESGQPFNNVGP